MAKITIFSDYSCSGCRKLKKAIQELKIKGISIVNINKHLGDARKFKVYSVPTAVIDGKKYTISRDTDCLIFQNKNRKIKLCKQI